MAMETQGERLKEQEQSRSFFGVVRDAFRVFARKSSTVLGSPWAFAAAILVIVAWALTGPTFHYSDTWQLIINTGTTIVTFLMVFLIQNTQNRDAKAMHLKLDEIIRALKSARNELVDLEELDDGDLRPEPCPHRTEFQPDESRSDDDEIASFVRASEPSYCAKWGRRIVPKQGLPARAMRLLSRDHPAPARSPCRERSA